MMLDETGSIIEIEDNISLEEVMDNTIDFLIEKVRVKTISLSLRALDINKNYEYNNPTHEK